MKRKLIFITLLLLSVTLFIPDAYALVPGEDAYNSTINYILENAAPEDIYMENGTIKYTEEYQKILDEKNKQVEKSYQKYLNTKSMKISDLLITNNNENVALPNGFCYTTRTLDVPTYQQEKNYWCGPAAVKEVLHFLNGSSSSQSTYATNMNTENDKSTYVYRLRNELNARQSTHTYQYEDITTESRFTEILISDVMDSEVGVPFVLHALTGSLYRYNGTTLHHYLVVNGGDMSKQTVTYVDSWASDYGRGTTLGRWTDSRSNVANTVLTSGRYVIW